MSSPLDDVEFLARSPAYAGILDALRAGPRTRRRLQAAVGATRTTVGRTLDELEARRWVARKGGRYEATALGALVAADFDVLVGTVEAARELRGAARWLVGDTPRPGPGGLGDAAVVTPERADREAPVRRAVELLVAAGDVRALLTAVAVVTLEPHWETIVGDGGFEAVTDADAVDALAGAPRTARRLRADVEAGRVAVYRHPEAVPHAVFVADGVVALPVIDGRGVPRALVETTDGAVRSAAESRFETCRGSSRPLAPGDLDPRGGGP